MDKKWHPSPICLSTNLIRPGDQGLQYKQGPVTIDWDSFLILLALMMMILLLFITNFS